MKSSRGCPNVALLLLPVGALRRFNSPWPPPCAKKADPPKFRGRLFATAWWRRGELNPRPKILYSGPLRAFPVIWISSPGTPAGRVPFGPSREKARPSAPREEASGYPVRVTSLRLYGHSTVGGRRLKPPELTDSRWRLLVSRFLRGAGPRHATHEHRHPRRSRFAPLSLYYSSLADPWGTTPKARQTTGGGTPRHCCPVRLDYRTVGKVPGLPRGIRRDTRIMVTPGRRNVSPGSVWRARCRAGRRARRCRAACRRASSRGPVPPRA